MHIQNLADHTLLLALPAFAPAVVVVGVVVYVAMRDRRRNGDAPHSDGIAGSVGGDGIAGGAGGENPDSSGQDESP